jgi:hypothetical protein
MLEEWRPVLGWEDLYHVSSLGRVKRVKGNKLSLFLKPAKVKKGYLQVALSRNSKKKYIRVHKMVAMAFIGPMPDGHEINHKDLNKENCCYSNLEYLTHQQNIDHAKDNGALKAMIGEKNGSSKLKNNDIVEIRRSYNSGKISYKELANKFKISKSSIAYIIKGERWKSIPMVAQ